MFDFTYKVVVVTGASGISLGKTIARKFYETGAYVAICSRNEERIRASAAEIAPEDRKRMFWVAADTTSVSQLRDFTKAVIEKYGRIDFWINNAGISFPKPSLDVTEEDWDRTVDTNLKGYFFGAQCAAREMVERGISGCIVNIGSVNYAITNIGETVYAATKSGVSKMTENLAREWGPMGIRVNCIAPGSVPTQMNKAHYADIRVHQAMCDKLPLRRRGTPEEIADAVMYMVSEDSKYITGQTLLVDGGLSLVKG